MNRKEWQKIAKIRLEEAETLLASGHYSGAYYLCGYAIECALKACIAKQTKRYDFPDKNLANDSWTHDLAKLVKLAGLDNSLKQEIHNDRIFDTNWSSAKDWKEESRYQTHSKKDAYDLYNAISNNFHGVMKWIKQHW